ncbi:cysteine-rich VLP domain-containing protein [uncultured Anaerotruncus sp.]|nr:cysteine-rich VLP domain-containing protein [uncultured Anaerotruncus sp.]
MTPAQRKRANALIRKTCCNYNGGNCLLLDDGEECVCPQTISYSVCCKWFRWAVLPQDKALEAGIFRSASVKRCAECGAAFVPRSNRAKYCPECAARVHRRQKNASDRKRRRNTDK